jgi:DNA recombination protein RmuC
MEFLYLAVGLAIGLIAALFYVKAQIKNERVTAEKQILEKEQVFQNEKNLLEKTKTEAETQVRIWDERHTNLKKEADDWKVELQELREENKSLNVRLENAKVQFKNQDDKLKEQKADLEELQKKFTTEFENVANKILEKNSEKFTAANQKNIGEVLHPLKEQIKDFEEKVENTYKQGLKDQTDLRAELKKLHDLNSKISEEATNLTKALKGDVKKQGNWGEVVLERILERSGLNEGTQGYEKQFSDVSEEGKRIQPDIVINLPDNKHIIVDSKVSLIAYERAVTASTEEERLKHVKEHLLSLKAHIKGLSEKHYQSAGKLNSPDFVLLFIPIESSFSLAIQEDQELFSYAWEQKVVLVSPSTLLATLRTITSIWQQENQTKYAIEIAKQGGALYDKFVGFIADMETIGKNLATTQKTYDGAVNKLHTGAGNLVRRAENIKKLGAKATKELPKKMLDE